MTDLTIFNDDLKLAASMFEPAQADTSVVCDVLCLHGISNSRDTWQETVNHIGDRYRVWALDFRGHGHSDQADRYLVEDYASDAAAALKVIAKPTIIIGHSLGGIVASCLAQDPPENLRAVLMEDPPSYLNEVEEWNKTVLARAFPLLRDQQRKMQADNASLQTFTEYAANSPSVLGGVVADHQSQRHLDSNGSALQRHDPDTWEPALNMTMLAAIDSSEPLKVPSLLLQADHALGPAFLKGHEHRFLATNPTSQVVMIAGAPHRIHATRDKEARFLALVDEFLEKHADI